jgi:uncharacterized membrane protein
MYLQVVMLKAAVVMISLHCATGRSLAQEIACHYSVIVLPPTNCFGSPGNVIAINDLGEVLLTGVNCGEPSLSVSYLWTGGPTLSLLPHPPGTLGFRASDLNEHGLIVGTAETGPTGGTQRGYIYNRNSGQWTEIPPLLDGSWSGAHAVNNAGKVCGYRGMGPSGSPRTAFIWSDGIFTDMGLMNGQSTDARTINEAGVATGTLWAENVLRPFLWDGKTLTVLPTAVGLETHPRAMSDNNRVAGFAAVPYPGAPGGFVGQAFHYFQGTIDVIGALPGHARSSAQYVRSDGVVLGLSRALSGGGDRAFIWQNGALTDLNSLVIPEDVLVGFAGDMTDGGVILASGTFKGINAAMLLLPVPPIGDTDGNCVVNVDDLIRVILDWGLAKSPADVNDDGIVNVDDLILVINNWTF